MARRPSRRDVSTGILIVLLAGVLVSQTIQAGANHMPADKVVANGSKVVKVEADLPPLDQTNTVGTTILSATFKSSAPSDLLMQVTLECSIITEILNQGGSNVPTSTGEAEGRIRVWLTFDGTANTVPINTTSTNPQPSDPTPIGNDTDYVTFCNRNHKMTVTDAEDGMDGTDTYRTYLRTKDANAFNWVYLNAGNGIHTVTVQAAFDEPTTATTGSMATGLVGNRMLIIEPTKMSNHAAV